MAKIKFISVLKQGSGRMEDVVFSSWKGRLFMKPYKKQRATFTDGQQEIRNSFTATSKNWKSLAGIVCASWEEHAEGRVMTGYNAFMGENINPHRAGKMLTLCMSMGMEPLAGFTATTGTGPGVIEARFSPVNGGKHVAFFVQKKEDAVTGGSILFVNGGMDLPSPFKITGMESGTEYHVYAVVTDKAYTEAASVSASVSASAVAGA